MAINQFIKSQEELDSYIQDIDSGKLFGVRYTYYGDYTADSFPCIIGLYLDDTQYSMSYYGTAYGIIVCLEEFNE